MERNGRYRYIIFTMSQNPFFDEVKWHKELTTKHDWYRVIYPEFAQILATTEGSDLKTRKASRDAIYGFLEGLMRKGVVVLAKQGEGKNWDAERKPIDTVVIHHTNVESGITWERISAMQLLRLYAKSYLSPSTEKEIAGTPVYSNHFRGDIPVFYGYHWLARTDGSCERLLADNEIGWQAGNWDINCRSVAICLDGDFRTVRPPEAMLDGVRTLLREQYPHIESARIIPHRVANPQTTCPGDWYDGVMWK